MQKRARGRYCGLLGGGFGDEEEEETGWMVERTNSGEGIWEMWSRKEERQGAGGVMRWWDVVDILARRKEEEGGGVLTVWWRRERRRGRDEDNAGAIVTVVGPGEWLLRGGRMAGLGARFGL